MFKKKSEVVEEVEAAKVEGRAPNVRLWGWRVQAVAAFKDGNVSGKKVWKAEEEADVSVAELEQLQASAPGNWNKLRPIHAKA